MNVSDLFDQLRGKYLFSMTSLKADQQKVTAYFEQEKRFWFFPTGYGKSILHILPPLLLDLVGVSCETRRNVLQNRASKIYNKMTPNYRPTTRIKRTQAYWRVGAA